MGAPGQSPEGHPSFPQAGRVAWAAGQGQGTSCAHARGLEGQEQELEVAGGTCFPFLSLSPSVCVSLINGDCVSCCLGRAGPIKPVIIATN